ncbi:MAG TPA: ATP-binding cassette domain-containing protein [Streptosporangiaceae bacterium]|nr:ATP-binding cassette domain-containing protein [Streptosporangiaceae bacterium]
MPQPGWMEGVAAVGVPSVVQGFAPEGVTDGGLQVEGLSVHFGGLAALDGVSLSVTKREIVGIIGPNGAGKTTLFNVICGFVRPTSGTISYAGRSLNKARPHQLAALGIGRTLQGLGLFPAMTVLDNVMTGLSHRARADLAAALLGLHWSHRNERSLREQAVAALERLELTDAAGQLPSALPYQLQKRVALARALVAQPRLLLLDEPAAGLAEEEMASLGELLLELRREMGILLVEHHMDLVMSVSDRIAVLDFGRVIAAGTPDEIRANPEVTRAYLGAAVGREHPSRPTAPRPQAPSGVTAATPPPEILAKGPSGTTDDHGSPRTTGNQGSPGTNGDQGSPGIVVEGLSVHYGAVQALRGVSFTAPAGAVTAVLGANGAGKSTLLRAMTGLVHPVGGRATIAGHEVTGKPPEAIARLGVSHVPEAADMIGELTVEENLRLGGLWRRDRADAAAAIQEVYDSFPPLAARRNRSTFTLSGGERQMLAIGRALAARPTALLLDEPSLGLAPRVAEQIMQLIGELVDSTALTVLLVEQNARSALSIADRAIVLSLGRVVVSDDAAAVGSDDALRHHYLGY